MLHVDDMMVSCADEDRAPVYAPQGQPTSMLGGGPSDPAAAVASPQEVPAHVLSEGLHPDDIARRLAGGSGVPPTQSAPQLWTRAPTRSLWGTLT